MQAVLLAGGKSARTLPLTLRKPKPLLRVANISLLEWNLRQLEGLVDDIIVVVGHGKEMVQAAAEQVRLKARVRFAEQKEQKGTGDALRAAAVLLGERFLVLNGDDLYWRKDIANCLKQEQAVLASEMKDEGRRKQMGIVEVREGRLARIAEKPAKPASLLVNTGLYVLKKSALAGTPLSKRGERELTDMVNAEAGRSAIAVVQATFWQPVGYPWHVLEANQAVLALLKDERRGSIEKGATVKGPVRIGKNTVVRAGAYIEGPVVIGDGCSIGPNCYIRPSTSIGDNCKIGNAVEIKNCVIGSSSHIGHLSYFGDSVLGDGVNIGAGTIAANLRHDNASVQATVKGRRVDTDRRKFGCVIADGVHTGVHTSIYPGRKLSANTLPGEIVKKDR